ncbi:TetR/AcrR family transcriptional regulator [Falsiroseomonas tokyonensis]|uniref:TetR/AcrR family transcriptional regulator n=1 Tax=Falsiroseomonas tokyonensis TaxID=430521 RepID=A0ABV7BX10_9PROT|nr:TetR family transcriptional regulator [Falsiroseomonas tokyonensis]MBU8539184.1 TetR family transcriptional regulator [Falsiroseomonas tokyonensis]
MSTTPADRPKAAERIQAAAKDLFYRHGIRATGIEEVCRVADATKMSLYRTYPSKDALVAAVLCDDGQCYDAWFQSVIADAPTPAARLQALVDAVVQKLRDPDYRGCPLLLAQAEFPDPAHPIHQLVAGQKAGMRDRLVELARQAGAKDPVLLGESLAMLMDGAWASLPYLGGERAGQVLRQGAEAVLRGGLVEPFPAGA